MSAPITYTSTPINDDYVFTSKKYAISNGRPGSTGFINYRNNPNSKTWYPAYNYDQYHPNGTGYYIISNTRVQGGHATAGNEIPTFHVTGNTDNAILHLINRLPNRGSNFYTSIETAKEAIINDSESLHFDAALSKYAYYAPQFLKLNFDFGNLNCDIKKAGSAGDVYNFTSNLSGYLRGIADDYLFDANDNSSFYRRIDDGVQVPLTISSGLASVACSATEDFVIAVCVKLENTNNDIQILEISNPFCILSFNSSTNRFEFSSRGDIVTTSSPISNLNFHTIIFGRDVTNNKIFIYVNDDTNNLQSNISTPSSTFQSLTFSSDFFIGKGSNARPFYLGVLQYWKGTGLVDASDVNNLTMSDVSQSNFTAEIYAQHFDRWM